jgi:pimeloyl-ACP methyl ester carboxylesterase
LKLHTKDLGGAGPRVLFESGIAASHLNWMGIAPRVAEFARVRLYDRAGYGFSPPAVEPRTAWHCSQEVPLDEPGVIVAHSFGALIAREFAASRPDLVQGLVLVDPIIQGEFAPPTEASRKRLRQGQRAAAALTWAARFGLVRLGIPILARRRTKLRQSARQLFDELSRLPPETWPVIQRHWSRPESFRTLGRYFESLEESCRRGLEFRPLGDIPVTVISGAHLLAWQREEHARLARISTQGRHLQAAEGRHWVHLDQPDLVVEAIREQCLASHRRV